ncbi:hypothetical protein Rhe02_78400 [Rhizocola hellebori]|uniref:Uncharacterized protein n=1 Tax=Rhizocola hellebori TaxID=1392758 RepID=A0A8J3QI29_9ACTN|nr:hypothetical protein [Rhizocola hellebori]GIH09773.1 hypothetical protein Rhe02_78400 [Rhizocola hellebori]
MLTFVLTEVSAEGDRVDPIVVAAGTALVSAMATDVWQQARTGMITLWRRFYPQHTAAIEADLDALRTALVNARQAGRTDVETVLAGVWQGRLHQLLHDNPTFGVELRALLDEVLTPLLTPTGQTRIGTLTMNAVATDHGRVFQAGHDQQISER